MPFVLWIGHRLGSWDPERKGRKGIDSRAGCGSGEETQPSPCDAACQLSWKLKPLSFEGPIKVRDVINSLLGGPPPSRWEATTLRANRKSRPWIMRCLSPALTIPPQPWLQMTHLCDHKSASVCISICSPHPRWKGHRGMSLSIRL